MHNPYNRLVVGVFVTRIRKNMKLYLYLAGVMLVSAQRGESTLLNTSDRVLGSAVS